MSGASPARRPAAANVGRTRRSNSSNGAVRMREASRISSLYLGLHGARRASTLNAGWPLPVVAEAEDLVDHALRRVAW